MASSSLSEEDLSCPVCCDIFINPVLLSCSHSFCSSCVQRVWENQTFKVCPVCRTTSSNDRPPVNLALKNLCESFQQERRQKSSSEGETVCRDHKEKLKLFCLDDQQPVCVVCRDSKKHANHRFSPVDEVVADNKEILKASLERLQEELRTSVNREQNLCKTAEDVKFHTQCIETQIKEEFEKLHQFLHDEEAARITALREEEEKRSQMMKKKIEETSKQISSLTITIRDIEEQMKAEDVSFLQNFEATLQRAQYILDPDPSPSVTITFTDHLANLKLNVLQKMQDNVGKTSDFNIESKQEQEKEIRPAFYILRKREPEKEPRPAFHILRNREPEKETRPAFHILRNREPEKETRPAFHILRKQEPEKETRPAFHILRKQEPEKETRPAFHILRKQEPEKETRPAFHILRNREPEKETRPAFHILRKQEPEKETRPAFHILRKQEPEKETRPAFHILRKQEQEKETRPAFESMFRKQEQK